MADTILLWWPPVVLNGFIFDDLDQFLAPSLPMCWWFRNDFSWIDYRCLFMLIRRPTGSACQNTLLPNEIASIRNLWSPPTFRATQARLHKLWSAKRFERDNYNPPSPRVRSRLHQLRSATRFNNDNYNAPTPFDRSHLREIPSPFWYQNRNLDKLFMVLFVMVFWGARFFCFVVILGARSLHEGFLFGFTLSLPDWAFLKVLAVCASRWWFFVSDLLICGCFGSQRWAF